MTLLQRSVVFWLVTASAALAQDYTKCDGTTLEMRMCMSKFYQRSDAELNAVYLMALQALGPYTDPKRHIDNLRTSERLWMAYWNAQCKAQYDLFEGGTGPIENLACLIGMTNNRTGELKRLY